MWGQGGVAVAVACRGKLEQKQDKEGAQSEELESS